MTKVQSKVIHVSGINSEQQQYQIQQQLMNVIGVHNVAIDSDKGEILIKFETPASLNNLEKEIYDLGYQIF
ncbi:putative copper chaperone CsoZ [Staphylococcus pseudoxylosus]|uniref:putative copper chaperone CsoZ n=1 Tax=Staphylococcus pseudoxylosus TaxID=2282419 RepID=UPI0026B3042C|nr:heavy-metal-associated domain-containing protein [Staphylococcus pseudoxylosus]MDW8544706.1 heavy-metal-associated domain-containing protein [Staphylococcus pseudoxylosus]